MASIWRTATICQDHAESESCLLACYLPMDHDGPHFDLVDKIVWRVVTSRALPRVTQAYLTPSADLPACRDEDPVWTAAAHPDPPEYQHPEEPQ